MNKIIGIVLLVVGGFLLVKGFSRQDSLVGQTSEIGTDVANAVDGGTRQPKHIIMMVGGGILFIAGAGMAFRRTAA